ncbi:MAG: hypothetical protein EXS10_10600 [Phycisphaerales bacterium]|nr:hypothetical protein [Phycisphaerales bacterium]
MNRGLVGVASVVFGLCASSAFAQVANVQVGATSTKKIVAVVSTTTNAVVATKVIEKSTVGVWTETVSKSNSATAALVATATTTPPPPPPLPIINDCNNNGIDDGTELATGAADWDNDGRLDVCETAAGDLNLNGVVDSQDVSILLGWWGVPNPLFGDLNSDGIVDATDLGTLLARFGPI